MGVIESFVNMNDEVFSTKTATLQIIRPEVSYDVGLIYAKTWIAFLCNLRRQIVVKRERIGFG